MRRETFATVRSRTDGVRQGRRGLLFVEHNGIAFRPNQQSIRIISYSAASEVVKPFTLSGQAQDEENAAQWIAQ